MTEAGLIDAIAAALAAALKAHGIPPAAGNPTIAEQCAQLCRDWGGETHWLPKTWKPGRDAVIVAQLTRGATTESAAAAAHCGPATVARVRQRLREQPGLGREDWYL